MTTTELVPVGERTLDELAQDINSGHAAVVGHLTEGLSQAIQVGEWLVEAQDQVFRASGIKDGKRQKGHADFSAGWNKWLDENVTVSLSTAKGYMRLATFKHLLPERATASESLAYLRQIGARREAPNQRFSVDPKEARRLRDSGLGYQEIADMLGSSLGAVYVACMSASEKKQRRAQYAENRRRVKQALKQAEKQQQLKNVSGDLAEAYSLVRKALQHAQVARDNYPNIPARRTMEKVLRCLHEAEDGIALANKERNLT